MRRVAAFDCGTNTIKLLIAELEPETGAQTEILRDLRMVRLGQDVDRTGVLAPEAIARAFAAIEEFVTVADQHDVESVRFCATSAARDAGNAEEFRTGVMARVGVPLEVLSGDEEARLTYIGATRGVPDRVEPTLVVDIGGGSTELVIGTKHRSLDIGSVRMTERHLHSDPATAHEVETAAASIDRSLDTLSTHGIFLDLARTVVGVAGTITTLTAMALDLPDYDRVAIHGASVEVSSLHEIAARLLRMTVDERRALPFMHPGRADVIGAGALILDRIARRLTVDRLQVSESDILDGIAWSMV